MNKGNQDSDADHAHDAHSPRRAARVVEQLFAQQPAGAQALRRQWMKDLQLPVATIDDIVNAGGKLPKTSA